MRHLLALALLLAACKEPPPPVAEGRCIVVQYTGEKPSLRWCAYQGYDWSCTSSKCDRVRPSTAEDPPPPPDGGRP